MDTIKVGVLGATGAAGQRFVQLLDGHPWFEISALAASNSSAGNSYADACAWRVSSDMPAAVRDLEVLPVEPGFKADIVFSALPSSVAGPVEEAFAEAGYIVCSNASSHRMDSDVPLIIPEVNPQHLSLIPHQQRRRGWDKGYIIANPNCSTIHLVLALKPVQDAFGIERVMVTTMQALSGAGYPGVSSLDIVDNVVPYIGGEEEKVETEPLKLLGRFDGEGIEFADITISAQANRVATIDGHLEAVSVDLAQQAPIEDVMAALGEFRAEPQELGLPSAPERPIVVRPEPDRPQPRLDRMAERGMAAVVGRVRECPVFDVKFAVLGHNTIRGAAGASILNAELLVAKGYLGDWSTAADDKVRLSRALAAEMIQHARERAPEEVCGIVAGENGHFSRVYAARNVAENPSVTYEMDPQEQLRIFKEIDERSWDVAGIYHSHPASPAHPSPTDMRLAFYPSVVYFIVSLMQPDRPVVRAFRLDQERNNTEELELAILD
ncbi:MAG: Aspartate-semialdehyde dehydrogenase 2 [Anaerolineales bacterium]|nr:Aspartate-semialdehyde dehydrogenase 2 [Anaerolineales bacterium]